MAHDTLTCGRAGRASRIPARAPQLHWTEQRTSDPPVGGSNPSGAPGDIVARRDLTDIIRSVSRIEARLIAGLAGISLVLRAIAFFHYRFDSDEPQHLHVAWGWTAGLLQYRDVFDNHA